jgi:hypothetical protein
MKAEFASLDTRLKGESHLLVQIKDSLRTEPESSPFYIKPEYHTVLTSLEKLVAAQNNIPRKGMMCKSTFVVRSKYPVIEVFKECNVKPAKLLTRITF